MPIRRLDKTLTATTATVAGEDIAANSIPVKPHIQYGILQPAVAGKLLNGSTSHSGAYGTAQSDGHSYYYTDIKGSKPIKDPRIGAHFGSQRHKTTSVQLLEQETATHGENVYSVDGREWMRYVAPNLESFNNEHGTWFQIGSVTTGTNWLEITGYFNAVNWSALLNSSTSDVNLAIDGTANSSVFTGGSNSVLTPLGSRYVDASSLISLIFDSTPTLGIHTVKISNVSGDYFRLWGIELIAQDTTSTATKSKIQIPAQNVVSYGKKFALSAAAHHYDPFNGFTNGTTLHSAVVDTATSLGLDTAPGSSAKWAISGSNNIRPYNGGRVVKWVASDGTIKTSVNMMPPNAQNIKTTASNEITTPSATNTTTTPNMSDDAVDHSLSEAAKTYHWREFGNGAANQGTGATNYADFSMHINNDSTQDNMGYVMDDGLTGLGGSGSHTTGNPDNITSGGDGSGFYFTFIGTGITIKTTSAGAGTRTMALNLPYGTHVYKHFRDAGATPDGTIDGVALADIAGDTYSAWEECTFHQPKMPPIPEDACILADYMLMADYVTNATAGLSNISKGVRRVGASRDVFYDQASGTWGVVNVTLASAFHSPFTESSTSAIAKSFKLPFFGNGLERPFTGHSNKTATITPQFSVAGAAFANANAVSPSLTITSSTSAYNSGTNVLNQTVGSDDSAQFVSYGNNLALGVNEYKESGSASGYLNVSCLDIVSPVHTSSHYQSFETPFLHELVGGDRNMEQNNLVVTSDGKIWDQVTRDTSYLSNIKVRTNLGNEQSITNPLVFSEWRGKASSGDIDGIDKFNKDFAIGHGRLICLVPSNYQITWWVYVNNDDAAGGYTMYQNGVVISQNYSGQPASNRTNVVTVIASPYLNRGDYITMGGTSAISQQNFEIIKI